MNDKELPLHNTADALPGKDSGQTFELFLSGGGFRATLFHLGVLRYLLERGRLEQVRRVYSISGGSILAAFLATNWRSFADLSRFALAAEKVTDYAQSDVRGRLLRRFLAYIGSCVGLLLGMISALLFCHFNWYSIGFGVFLFAAFGFVFLRRHRHTLISGFEHDLGSFLRQIDQQKTHLRELKLRDLPNGESAEGIQFHILATDLTTGEPWAFTSGGVAQGIGKDFLRHDLYPLKSAVAASAAFPPMFSPVKFSQDADRNTLSFDHFLADGGVYDNLGLAAAIDETRGHGNARLIVSNAERRFDNIAKGRFSLLFQRAARSTDILMNRVSTLHEVVTHATHVRLAEESEILAAKLPISTQRLIRNIRTDLDRFTPCECQLLVFKGYLSAWETLDDEPPPLEHFHYTDDGVPVRPKDEGYWLPFALDELSQIADVGKEMRESHENTVGLISLNDKPGLAQLFLAIVLLLALNPMSWWSGRFAWRHLPAWPTAPMGKWNLDETQPLPEGLATLKSYLWSRIRPQHSDEILTNGIFISDPLLHSYGLWPHGEFICEFDFQEPLRPVRTAAYLIAPDGQMRYLPIKLDKRTIGVAVPAGSSDRRLCVTLAVIDDTMVNGVRSDGSSNMPKLGPQVVDIRAVIPTESESVP